MNLFIKICIVYIILFFSFKLIRWLVVDIFPNIESREGKDTVRFMLLAFIGLSMVMIVLRLI